MRSFLDVRGPRFQGLFPTRAAAGNVPGEDAGRFAERHVNLTRAKDAVRTLAEAARREQQEEAA